MLLFIKGPICRPSRVTAGPGETFSRGPSGRSFLIFFKWRILVYFIFSSDGGLPNVAGPWATYPPALSLHRPAYLFLASKIANAGDNRPPFFFLFSRFSFSFSPFQFFFFSFPCLCFFYLKNKIPYICAALWFLRGLGRSSTEVKIGAFWIDVAIAYHEWGGYAAASSAPPPNPALNTPGPVCLTVWRNCC